LFRNESLALWQMMCYGLTVCFCDLAIARAGNVRRGSVRTRELHLRANWLQAKVLLFPLVPRAIPQTGQRQLLVAAGDN